MGIPSFRNPPYLYRRGQHSTYNNENHARATQFQSKVTLASKPPSICKSLTLQPISERKYKEKIKEWRFDKYVDSNEMNFIVAKGQKRRRDEGKETVFFRGQSEITSRKIESFKKRRPIDDKETMSPCAGKAQLP